MSVRMEKCVKSNVLQMWDCVPVTSGWGLHLLSAKNLGFLVAISASKEFTPEGVRMEVGLVGKFGCCYG